MDIANEKDKRSYSIGLNAGRNLRNKLGSLPVYFDLEMTRKGIDDAYGDETPLLSDDELREALAQLQEELRIRETIAAQLGQGNVKRQEDTDYGTEARYSYGIGLNAGRNMKKGLQAQQLDVEMPLVRKGLDDAFTDAKPLIGDDEVQKTVEGLQKETWEKQKEMMEKQRAQMEEQKERKRIESEKNGKAGRVFLLANRKKAGVRTLPGGLQYRVLVRGTGRSPRPTDIVHVRYRGTLIDGTEFDSTYKRGQEAIFPVNGVIRGWTEALLKMKEGSKWELFVPGELAYGENGRPDANIGPNTVLIYEIELVSIAGKGKN